jgi:polyphosphate kinase
MSANWNNPEYYLNRELSWLEFNQRVLEEAQDPHQPLLERLKFLCIVSSNLDEFFEIRVGGIKQQIQNEVSDAGPDGLSAKSSYDAIRRRVVQLLGAQGRLWNRELQRLLQEKDIFVHEDPDFPPGAEAWMEKYFREEVFPALTPLAVDPSHPFPQLLNKSHNLIVLLQRSKDQGELSHAIVQIPRMIPRLVKAPLGLLDDNGHHYFLLKSIIKRHVGLLFPGLKVLEAHAFRITRNSDLYIDEEEAENLLRTIEEELRKRNKGNAVRLEVQSDCPVGMQHLLLEELKLSEGDLYVVDGPLTFLHLLPLCQDDTFASLKDKPFVPIVSKAAPAEANIFEVLRRQDILLHHPYESFSTVVDFVERAAEDLQVLAIKITLYRTSGDSPIVRALIRAAQNGKQVTALIELKARFDEANNIQWARQMEEAGVHVVYGVVGLKLHCKMLMVVRRDEDGIRHYAHLGTGNYHPSTARFYTDLGLMTIRTDLTLEMANLFNILTGMADFSGVQKLIVAPFSMLDRFQALIVREIENAKKKKPARIVAKMNALVDEDIIQSLYAASKAGVKIDLIVRGICCLRPGVPGVSENIRVMSIVGRFLEHSRLYCFENGGDPEVYLGSADWMPRNFHRRIEVVFPVEDPRLKDRLLTEIIPTFLNDNVKARILQPDGKYIRLKPARGEKAAAAQLTFRDLARKQAQTFVPMTGAENGHSTGITRLTPLTRAPAER